MKKWLLLLTVLCGQLFAAPVFMEDFNRVPDGWKLSKHFRWEAQGGIENSGVLTAIRESAKEPLFAIRKIKLEHNVIYRLTVHYRTEMKPTPKYKVQEIFAIRFFKKGAPASGVFSMRNEPGSRREWGTFTSEFSLPGDSDDIVQLSLLLRSGREGQIWYDNIVIEEVRRLQKPELRGEAFLTHGDIGCATVNFITASPMVAAVDYRIAGRGEWLRRFNLLGGQARNDQTMQSIKLTNLRPGVRYEYRVVMMPVPETQAEFYSSVKSFVSFPRGKSNFSVFYTSDTQTSGENRKRVLRNFIRHFNVDKVDLIVHGGDIDSLFDEPSEDVFMDSFINVLNSGSQSKFFVAVRGNHEYRGSCSAEFFKYLTGGGDKSYYAFTYGQVFFIVLDTGETTGRIAHLKNYCRNYEQQLIVEQRRFLQETVNSDAFKKAKFRVVLAHAPLERGQFMTKNIDGIAKGILYGTDSPAKIHLWLAGHTHIYCRPSSDGRLMVFPNAQKIDLVQGLPFVTVVNDGPGCGGPDFSGMKLDFSDDAITIYSFDESGKVFDNFAIDPDGKVKEIKSELIKK